MSDSELVDEMLFEEWMASRERNAADLRRAQAEAEERRQSGPVPATVAGHLRVAASHRSTAAFFREMAVNEPDAIARKAHSANAALYLRRAQEAEALARAAPAGQQRALVSNGVENAN